LGVVSSEAYFAIPYLHKTHYYYPTMCYTYLEFCEEQYLDDSLEEMTKHLKKVTELEIGKTYEIICN
jgi:hypothetical protein